MCRAAGPRGQGDREAEPWGQGDAEAWDGRVSRSEETGTPGQEYRRGRAVIGWTGTLGREDGKKKKKGTTAEGSVRPPPGRTVWIYPGRAQHGATTGPGHQPGR